MKRNWVAGSLGNSIGKSGYEDNWPTRQKLVDYLVNRFSPTKRIDIDVAADHKNHKAQLYYTAEDNGLLQDWNGKVCWCGCPFSLKPEFINKAIVEVKKGAFVIMILPATTDSKWFKFLVQHARIYFFTGRSIYEHREEGKRAAPNFCSMVAIFGKGYAPGIDGELIPANKICMKQRGPKVSINRKVVDVVTKVRVSVDKFIELLPASFKLNELQIAMNCPDSKKYNVYNLVKKLKQTGHIKKEGMTYHKIK